MSPIDDVASETLVLFGESVKALGKGEIGGILAPFGSPSATDAHRDYFTQATDFGLDVSSRTRVMVHHGYTKAWGRRKIGVVGMGLTARGVEAIEPVRLDLANDAQRKIYEDAEAGKLFWSTGTSPHLMERRSVGNAREVTSWPIVEASLTYNPVNRSAAAMALKAIVEGGPDDLLLDTPDGPPATGTLAGDLTRLATDARRLVDLSIKAATQRRSEGRDLSHDKIAAIEALHPELSTLAESLKALVASPPAPGRVHRIDPERLARIDKLARLARVAALEPIR